MSLTAFVLIAGEPPEAAELAQAERLLESFLSGLTEKISHVHRVGNTIFLQSSVYDDESATAVSQSFDSSTSTDCAVVFDGWLENRGELIAELRKHGVSETSSNCSIVLAAWNQWGDKVADRLYGEYSFAAHRNSGSLDKAEVFAVRDKVGIRPLFYSQWEGGIAISNFPGALSVIPWLGSAINEGYAAEFLAVEINSIDETLYRNVARIRGGHAATWSASSGLITTRYWQPSAKVVRTTDEHAAISLRKHLDKVVLAASRSSGPLGIQVSGGVDSSSVACVVADLVTSGELRPERVTGMSQIYPGLPCDESPYIDAIEKVLPFRLEKIQPTYAIVAVVNGWTKRLRYPVFSFASTASIVHDANHRQRGGRIVLTGEGGDELFQPTAPALTRLDSISQLSLTLRHLQATWRAHAGRVNSRGAFALTLETVLPLAARNRLARLQRRRHRTQAPIDVAWQERVGLIDRLDQVKVTGTARTQAVELVLSGRSLYAFEHMYETNFVRGVEKRCPLLSATILEFVNQLPLEIMDFPGGRNRHPLRASVRALLPSAILNRFYKSEFTASVLPALLANASERFGEDFDSPRLSRFGRSTLAAKSLRYVWQLDAAQAFRAWITETQTNQA